jgi:hypothetical protein
VNKILRLKIGVVIENIEIDVSIINDKKENKIV